MKKSKTIFHCILWLALYGVSYFLILLILALVFREHKINELKEIYPLVQHNMLEKMFDAFLKTDNFKIEFMSFFKSHLALYTSLNLIPLCIFTLKYKKMKPKKNVITRNSLLHIFIISLVFSVVLNIVLSQFSYQEISLNVWYIFLSGIIGPITEELFFRGILYQKLQTSFSKKVSFIIIIFIFTILHQNLTTMIYAFIMGIWFTYLFDKYKNIKISIFAHITGNIIVPLIIPYIYVQTQNYKISFLFFLGMIFFFTFLQTKSKENRE